MSPWIQHVKNFAKAKGMKYNEGEGFEFARPGGEYGFSSLVKQNKKAKICFVICFAGKRKLVFVYL